MRRSERSAGSGESGKGPNETTRSEATRSRSQPRLGPAYQGALEAALAVVVSMGIGVWADSYFGTSPVLLFVGLGIGFGAFILRLWRLLQETSASPGPGSQGEVEETQKNGRDG
jgi:F0F1-type ATP synthase assembly protein I